MAKSKDKNTKGTSPKGGPVGKYTKPVMVTTESKGVFFGYSDGTEAETITLASCRNCLYWSAEMKGVLGLAVFGPDDKCRIGPPASSLVLRQVTAIVDVGDAAAARWESEPWGE